MDKINRSNGFISIRLPAEKHLGGVGDIMARTLLLAMALSAVTIVASIAIFALS